MIFVVHGILVGTDTGGRLHVKIAYKIIMVVRFLYFGTLFGTFNCSYFSIYFLKNVSILFLHKCKSFLEFALPKQFFLTFSSVVTVFANLERIWIFSTYE